MDSCRSTGIYCSIGIAASFPEANTRGANAKLKQKLIFTLVRKKYKEKLL
jgi:hypothetical protein